MNLASSQSSPQRVVISQQRTYPYVFPPESIAFFLRQSKMASMRQALDTIVFITRCRQFIHDMRGLCFRRSQKSVALSSMYVRSWWFVDGCELRVVGPHLFIASTAQIVIERGANARHIKVHAGLASVGRLITSGPTKRRSPRSELAERRSELAKSKASQTYVFNSRKEYKGKRQHLKSWSVNPASLNYHQSLIQSSAISVGSGQTVARALWTRPAHHRPASQFLMIPMSSGVPSSQPWQVRKLDPGVLELSGPAGGCRFRTSAHPEAFKAYNQCSRSRMKGSAPQHQRRHGSFYRVRAGLRTTTSSVGSAGEGNDVLHSARRCRNSTGGARWLGCVATVSFDPNAQATRCSRRYASGSLRRPYGRSRDHAALPRIVTSRSPVQ
jgi:hypothetical protein